MSTIKNYLSLIKFSHTIFAMPFALIGFFLGLFHKVFGGEAFLVTGDCIPFMVNTYTLFTWTETIIKFVLVILCMVFARSAAMAFNRYLDRKFDAQNPRTAIREIPKGIITPKNALIFTIANCLLFVVTCFFINTACLILAPIALFVILFYSYTKRFTALCHLVLGVGLSLAPIGAYLAVTGKFALLPVLFSFTVLFWVSGFDIIYALQDEDFDKSQHLHSIPAALGKTKALRVSELLHLLSAACVITIGIDGHFGLWYWIGVAVFIGMLIYQHSIVKPNDLRRVNIAFMTANGIASVVFAVFVLLDIFIHH
ncbi:UbiA-like polyprenyltransferase [Ferruginibacter albus]|uniref:UbiA-like polyprenyltransferase n=1 Tax=Ferruginibacter albus TaxID=2875540 RepID=UPI001CC61EA3|nr:UbiA-like polyprenyltransferase [Ferruginibacter albus]UAY53546.1 putative 4-hydroxybenzoate polyprenyltransferase [Ferruginibacter albus]